MSRGILQPASRDPPPEDRDDANDTDFRALLNQVDAISLSDRTPATASQQFGSALQRRLSTSHITAPMADLLYTVTCRADDKRTIDRAFVVVLTRSGSAEIYHSDPTRRLVLAIIPLSHYRSANTNRSRTCSGITSVPTGLQNLTGSTASLRSA